MSLVPETERGLGSNVLQASSFGREVQARRRNPSRGLGVLDGF